MKGNGDSAKRFKIGWNKEYVLDDLIGKIINLNSREVAKELNKLNDKNDELAVKLYLYEEVMRKHQISSVEKLDKMLVEQKVW